MNRRLSRFVRITAIMVLMWQVPGCGHDQLLVFISVQPPLETFGAANVPVIANAGSSVELRALGSYIHPPVTKDITTKVTWASNTPSMVTVDAKGLLVATGLVCGNALVSATSQTNSNWNRTSSGALVTGYMTANVVCFTGAGPVLTVDFAGKGAGSIASSPPGLGCATTCSTSFPIGTTIALTAATNGSTFGGWVGCDATSGQQCTVNLTSNRTVTVTFN
jgi:hypothetical protein